MTYEIYPVEISCTAYVQANSLDEAERIARSRITDIVDNDPVIITADDPVTKVPADVADTLPWVSFLYSGPEYTVQQVIDLQQ